MSDNQRPISRRQFELGALAALGSSLALGCHEYRPACPNDVVHDDPLDGYEPRILTRRQCLTLAAAAEVMIAPCPPVISAYEIARRADFLLAAVESPNSKKMQDALTVLELFAGLLTEFDVRSFSTLDLAARRRVIDEFVAKTGVERDAVRVLKMLVVVPYYSHPEVRRAIGFIDYPNRARVRSLPVVDESRKIYPEPEEFGPAEAERHDRA